MANFQSLVVKKEKSLMGNRVRVCAVCILNTDIVFGPVRGSLPCGRCQATNCKGAIVMPNPDGADSTLAGNPIPVISEVPKEFMVSTMPKEKPKTDLIIAVWRELRAKGPVTVEAVAARADTTKSAVYSTLYVARKNKAIGPDEGRFSGNKAPPEAKPGRTPKPARERGDGAPRSKPKNASPADVVLRNKKRSVESKVARGRIDPIAAAIHLEIVGLRKRLRVLESMLEML